MLQSGNSAWNRKSPISGFVGRVTKNCYRFAHFAPKNGDFWHFLKKNCQISTKTSGNSPNCDIWAIWAMHVCPGPKEQPKNWVRCRQVEPDFYLFIFCEIFGTFDDFSQITLEFAKSIFCKILGKK